MDLNSNKKIKLTNSSLENVDEFHSDTKLINKLNHYCLSKVLMYLPVLDRLEMEQVCEKWKYTAESSWYNVKKLDFNDLMITLDKKEEITKTIIIRCGRYLRYLKIIHEQYPWMCDVFKNNCQNIIHFDINMVRIEYEDKYKICDRDLVEIISSMPKLKYLRVSMNYRQDSRLPYQRIINSLPENMQEIHLSVQAEEGDEYNEVAPVLNKFNALRCLTLVGFRLRNSTMEEILKNKNTLVKLELSYCDFPSSKLTEFSNLKNLEQLILLKVIHFNVNEIVSIARNCQRLNHFAFRVGSYERTPEKPLSYSIFRELKYLNLEHLEFSRLQRRFRNDNESHLSDIANKWKQLKYLNVGNGCYFGPIDYQDITKYKNLEFLNLYNTYVDSESFIYIANNCLELKELSMSFGDLSETALLKLTNLKKLEKLDFHYCRNLSGNVLFNVANNCKNLVDLNLNDCDVTEMSLIQVGKLEHLKKLNINSVKNVPNAMFDNLYNLEELSCRSCPSVTDEGIIKVIDNCLKLSFLHVSRTGVTVKTLVHAGNRQFVFTSLRIVINSAVRMEYAEKYISTSSSPSPYLIIY